MERRLGRGLGSLLGSQGGGTGAERNAPRASSTTGEWRGLPIQRIRPNPNQPRKVFESAALEELRDSIKTHGVLQPICVRSDGEEGYAALLSERN